MIRNSVPGITSLCQGETAAYFARSRIGGQVAPQAPTSKTGWGCPPRLPDRTSEADTPLAFVFVRSFPVTVGRSMGRGDIGVWGHMPIVTTTNSAAANDYGRQIGEHHCLRHSITTATSPLLKPQNATV